MNATRRLQDARLARLPKVAKLYLQNVSLAEIARRLGITEDQIGHDMRALRKRWGKRRERAAERIVEIELAKLDLAEEEAWRAWEKSKRDAETQTTETSVTSGKGDGGDEITEKKKQVKAGQVGDPRYLDAVLKCHEKRVKLHHLDSPERDAYIQEARVVEVVVDTPQQVQQIIHYHDYSQIADAAKSPTAEDQAASD